MEGKLQTRSWEQDGEKKYMTEIVADNITMLGSKGDSGGKSPDSAPNTENSPDESKEMEDEDDDLPF